MKDPRPEERRWHLQYLQQMLGVQVTQIAIITAIYGALLAALTFLIGAVGMPIENLWIRYVIVAAYVLLGLWLLALVGMRSGELYDGSEGADPLARGVEVRLDSITMDQTQATLHAMLIDNEESLTTKHRAFVAVVLFILAVTLVGAGIDMRQGAEPTAVVIVTPSPATTPTPKAPSSRAPKSTPKPTPHPSGSAKQAHGSRP